MSNRLALIVDDSRSARHILTRMLESFGLEVSAVESAELALGYLQGARPDVIFMDHLMPGMDGFAAVRVLKANPDTVTIPVLMYTSQEGEMYLSQARALGAMGVLPKTLKHADVEAALLQLNLLPERVVVSAAAAPAVPRPWPRRAEPPAAAAPPVLNPGFDPVPNPVFTEAEPPASVVPQLAHRIAAEVRTELQAVSNEVAAQINRRVHFWRVLAACCGLAGVLLLVWLLLAQSQIRRQLEQMQQTQAQLQGLLAQPPPAQASSSIAPQLLTSESLPVAYGEVPLSGLRLDYLRELQARYANDPRSLLIRIETGSADFCLNKNEAGFYEPAADNALLSTCEVLGNPFADALTGQQRQSVSFANLLASLDSRLQVDITDVGRQGDTAYPARSATLTAGEWNRVAEVNQQVRFTVQASPPP